VIKLPIIEVSSLSTHIVLSSPLTDKLQFTVKQTVQSTDYKYKKANKKYVSE